MSALHRFAQLFRTQRGLTLFSRNSLGAFGLLSGVLQIVLALWVDVAISAPQRWVLLGALLAVSLLFGAYRAWPQRKVTREFSNPDIAITVEVGDLFAQGSHLVIGFTDTFDTDTTNGVVISSTSVQGQFQEKVYGGDVGKLDSDLSDALERVEYVSTETSEAKPIGKLRRYPISTVATLGSPARHYFCVAYSKMENDLIAQSSVDALWKSLDAVWDAIHVRGQRKAVSIPIIGSELARVSCLNRESLLKMITLSFVARSRQNPVCKELRIVVHPKDFEHINMLEVDAFLRTL
ncbi:macro domain-containing protein [Streptomyces sp. AC550_RSS872]|uniref:macro domain-containing protein n=1 Tax=Streptomyces sp. AC550_RSS872 TaxID=2823689 RepID=UPI001C2757A3|nr:macro domain-containing protein [Streptomyces sp. AC550_RSS872]